MTTPDYCSSTATTTTESTMSNPSSNHHHHHRHQNLTKTAAEERGDAEVWNSLNHNFRQVQTVLDRNRVLIQQVNENHQSRIPDNMIKNVALIQEINGNISKVVSLYSNLSSDFSSKFHDQRTNKSDGSDKSESPPGPEAWKRLLIFSLFLLIYSPWLVRLYYYQVFVQFNKVLSLFRTRWICFLWLSCLCYFK